MIDAGSVLDQIVSHLNVVVDDRLKQRGPTVLVLGIHLCSGLLVHIQI